MNQNRKHKVYLFACTFPPFGRGNAITNACVASYLADYFAVEVISMEQEDGLLLSYQKDQSLVDRLHPELVVQRVRAEKWWGLNEILYAIGILPCYYLNWAWSVWRQRRALLRDRGVIFAVYPVFSNLVIACLLSRHFDLPLLVDFRDDFCGVMSRGWRRVLRPFYKWLEAWTLRQADWVTVTTEVLKRDMLERYDLDEDKISVVYNVVPSVPAAAKGGGEGPLKIIYAGAISRIQRPEILLQAYARLAQEDAQIQQHLAVEIYGPQSRHFRWSVKKHLVQGTSFGGFLPRQQLDEHLAEAAIGFLSLGDATYAYATPTKLFDYIEMGLPILAVLPPGAARQLIEELQVGLVVSLGDVDGLAQAMARLAKDGELRAQFKRNMARVKGQFQLHNQACKWRDALLEIAPNGREVKTTYDDALAAAITDNA